MVTLAQFIFLLSLVLLATPAAVYRRIATSFWLLLTASILSGITWWLATCDLGFYIPEIIGEMFLNGEYVGEFHTRQIYIPDAAIPLILYIIFTAIGLFYLIKKERQTHSISD